ALRARLSAMRIGAPADVRHSADELRRASQAIGWKPLDAEIEASVAVSAQIAHEWPESRAAFERSIDIAEQQHDYRLEATSRIGLLEVEFTATAQPGERGRAARLTEQARAAVKRAGDDPALSLAVDQIVASAEVEQGSYDAAITVFEASRRRFAELHAVRQVE